MKKRKSSKMFLKMKLIEFPYFKNKATKAVKIILKIKKIMINIRENYQ